MSRRTTGALAIAVSLGAASAGLLSLDPGADKPSKSAAQVRAGLDKQFARLPLRFEPNRGQASSAVDFLARGPGYSMALGPNGAVLALSAGKGSRVNGTGKSAVVGMHLVGANRQPKSAATKRLAGVSNYMVGDRKAWRTGVPSFGRVRYDEVYPGVDLVYRGNQNELRYDLMVDAGADPSQIAVGFKGSRKLSITDGGDLLIHARSGAIRQRRPVLFQGDGAARRRVAGHYVLKGDGRRVGFEVGVYDRSKPLVIDPTIAYSTHLGGYNTVVGNSASQEATNGIAVDSAGNTYVVGQTDSLAATPAAPTSTPYPTTSGALQTTFGGGTRDAFVTKLNPAGTTVLYSTYLGGSLEDRATDVAIGSNGNAYVSGSTLSTNFPTASPLQAASGGGRDAFIAQLNANGTGLVYSTYLGGGGVDSANRIALDASSAAHVGGTTGPAAGTAGSPSVTNDFPTTAGAFQSTFGGGVAGTSAPFAAPNDAFVTKINPAGSSVDYSTYLGGPLSDSGASIAVDSAGSAYVAGSTSSPNVFGTAGAFQPALNTGGGDAYVAKLNTTGTALSYATYLGGTQRDSGTGVAVDAAGSAFVTGETPSTDFPTKNANQPANASAPGPNEADSFVTKLNPAGSDTVFSTYNGSNTYDTGTDIAVDPAGNSYAVGNTLGGFPLKNPVQVRTGDYDTYLSKFSPTGALIYSTIYGGGSRDFGNTVAADIDGNAYIGGRTDYFSQDSFPVKNAVQPRNAGFADAWVAKINNAPTNILVNTLRTRSGPVTGGTQVIIQGVGFNGTSSVRFGATPAASFTIDSDTQITATSPAHAAGKVNVIVTSPAGTSPDNPVSLFEYAEGTWQRTGSLGVVHYDHQTTLLDNGKVLITGGQNSMFGNTITTTELYNPLTRSWNNTGSLNTARSSYRATRLDGPACRAASPPSYCGDVLVTGGSPNSASTNTSLASAETYNPSSGTWTTTTGSMTGPRSQHAATLLDGPECRAASAPAYCGKVLVAGGLGPIAPSTTNVPLSSAELYDPATRTFSTTGSSQHTARQTSSVLLPNGNVLLAGGTGNNRAGSEVYDPATGNWSSTASPLNIPRERESMVLLRNGKVLTAAGTAPGDPPYLNTPQQAGDSAELFDPVSNTWTLLPDRLIGAARNNHDTALLPSGKVLLAGGGRGGVTSELFDPADNKWRSGGLLAVSRGSGHPQSSSYEAIVLSSNAARFEADASVCGEDCGKVLVAGNNDDKSTELYTPEPIVSGVAPAGGPAAGGTSVTITGQGFTHDVTAVLFGTTPATNFTVSSYGQIVAIAPAGSGDKQVSVINEGGKATSAGSFSYVASVTPPPPPPAPVPPPPGVTPLPPPPPAVIARRKGKISATVSPARDTRAPYRFRTSGKLTLPSGMTRAVGCRGRVSVQIKRGNVTISTRRVSLTRTCTFSSRVSFANRRRFARAARLKFTVRFLGNSRVSPATATARYARIRR